MPDMEKLIKSYIPMSEASFLILAILQTENHGYGIMQKSTELTNGRTTLGAGTTYTILYKMENDGLITVTREIDRRKLYISTPLGRELLYHESQRLFQLAEIAKKLTNSQPVAATK